MAQLGRGPWVPEFLRVVSEGEGPPLLLLHDVLMDHHAFDDVVPGLRGDFRVVTPDLPGFGESVDGPPAGPLEHAQQLAEWADAIGIRGIVVHAISKEAKDFYLALGFDPSPREPMTLMVRLSDIRAALS